MEECGGMWRNVDRAAQPPSVKGLNTRYTNSNKHVELTGRLRWMYTVTLLLRLISTLNMILHDLTVILKQNVYHTKASFLHADTRGSISQTFPDLKLQV